MARRSKLFSSRNRELDDATVNLTPLIDVVFVVLIMFIIVAPMLELDKVILATNKNDASNTSMTIQDNGQITIQVYEDNSIWFNKEPTSIQQLGKHLESARRNTSTGNVHLFHDKRAMFGTYQSVKNAVESAGFDEMDVVLQPG